MPQLAVSNASSNIPPEPIFDPYHQFIFSEGFSVVPPPTEPYVPSSPPLILEFDPNFNTSLLTFPNVASDGFSGGVGSADQGASGCFHFNFYGASFGCDSDGPDCDFTFTGFTYDAKTQNSSQVAYQKLSIAACPALNNCALTPLNVDDSFQGLDYFLVTLSVDFQPKTWWMDDLRLGWTDNSCTTGLCRQSSPIKNILLVKSSHHWLILDIIFCLQSIWFDM